MEMTERNLEIVRRANLGETKASISRSFGISATRVTAILIKAERNKIRRIMSDQCIFPKPDRDALKKLERQQQFQALISEVGVVAAAQKLGIALSPRSLQ